MNLEQLVTQYINSAKHVLEHMEMVHASMTVDVDRVRQVVEYARNYLIDAEHYREKKKFEVSLTSVAYCEGLLDALRLLGAVRFEWPKTKKSEN